MNIKPWLEAEADTIVNAFRKQGGDVNDLIAKHAAERGVHGDQVHSLVWLVNRHHLKVAKREDGADEFSIANPELVIARMRRERKQASVAPPPALAARPGFYDGRHAEDGQVVAAGYEANDPAPIRLAKLAARRKELEADAKAGSARVRAGLFRLGVLAESVKRAGLLDSPTFAAELARVDEPVRAILETVLAHVKSARVTLAGSPGRSYVERAIADYGEMVKAARGIREAHLAIAEAAERMVRVETLAGRIAGQEA